MKLHSLAQTLLLAIANSVFSAKHAWREATQPRIPRGHGAGMFGRGLRNHFAALQRARLEKLPRLGDQHGVYTLVGRDPRRKWLAGISARRGY